MLKASVLANLLSYVENKQRLRYVFALAPSSVVRISMQVPGLICHPFLRPNCCFKVTIQRDECQINPWTDGYATLPGAPCYNGAWYQWTFYNLRLSLMRPSSITAWTSSKNCRTFMVPIWPSVRCRDMLRYVDTKWLPIVGIFFPQCTAVSSICPKFVAHR